MRLAILRGLGSINSILAVNLQAWSLLLQRRRVARSAPFLCLLDAAK